MKAQLGIYIQHLHLAFIFNNSIIIDRGKVLNHIDAAEAGIMEI